MTVAAEPKTVIRLPYNYTPRDYQVPVLEALDSGCKRAVIVWHRRAGKEKTILNYVIKTMTQRVGSYYYFLPTYAQAKKILWEGIDKDGFPFINHFPKPLIKKKNDSELKIELVNGSIFRLIGTDNYDDIVGTNPIGCVFSEFALQDPMCWDLFRPILRENKGWAIFDYTPRGKNHGFKLASMAKANPDWFYQLLTVRDTKRPDGLPVISEADIDEDRREGMSEEMIQQEYYCSFEGGERGAYYAKQFVQARADKRICKLPHVTGEEVHTFWDLGVDDSMTIWFMQQIGKEFRFIDYYENSGFGLEHYAKVLKGLPYVYGNHYMPHDAEIREMTNSEIALSRREVSEKLGIKPIVTVSRVRNMDTLVQVHIPAVRSILSQCYFDEDKCERGLAGLEGYRADYDETKKMLSNRPLHNWCSHSADAFRTFAVGYEAIKPDKSMTDYMALQMENPGWFGG